MDYRTKIKDGQFSAEALKAFRQIARELSDGHVLVSFYKVPPVPRLENYRRYYWSLCNVIHQFLIAQGHDEFTPEDVHERNKALYMREAKMDFVTMEPYYQQKSSLQLEQHEWNRIIDAIKKEWAERGLYLPDRNE